jgi:hypothetical protein
LLAAADTSRRVATVSVVMMNALFLIGRTYRVMTKAIRRGVGHR